MSSTPELSGPRSALALKLIALIGAALSFNRVRLAATPYAGLYGGIGTALLFDAAMWLASRWYLGTVRSGKPLRPALWLSLALAALTLVVNVNGAHGLADQVTHGIGPALFAAFTWLEAALQLRAYREDNENERERVAAGYVLVHPVRSARITLMMLGSGQTSFTAARAMCQNREAQRRVWRAGHGRGWRRRVDPAVYTAYRWAAFDPHALILTGPTGAPDTVPGAIAENVPEGVSGAVPLALENTARPALHAVAALPENTGRNVSRAVPGVTEISAVRESELLTAARDVERWRGMPSATRISKELGIGMPLAVSLARVLAEENQVSAQGGAPAPVASGRGLTIAQVADLIRTAGTERPGVREVMRTFAVSYDKAKSALDLLDDDNAA